MSAEQEQKIRDIAGRMGTELDHLQTMLEKRTDEDEGLSPTETLRAIQRVWRISGRIREIHGVIPQPDRN
jgi:hypothetical protein